MSLLIHIYRCLFMIRLLFTSLLLWQFLSADAKYQTKFNSLLSKGVEEGLVDYFLFKENIETLNEYIAFLVDHLSKDQKSKRAFVNWINLYNVLTLKLVIDHYPKLKSIRDLKKPWKIPMVTINKTTLSLDDIEHKKLRSDFNDYRVHFVLVCASLGCPDLRNSLYTYENIEEELEYETRKYLNSPKGTKLKGDKLLISKLFKWYGDDFKPNIKSVLKKYIVSSKKIKTMANNHDYLDYSWDLNDLKKVE